MRPGDDLASGEVHPPCVGDLESFDRHNRPAGGAEQPHHGGPGVWGTTPPERLLRRFHVFGSDHPKFGARSHTFAEGRENSRRFSAIRRHRIDEQYTMRLLPDLGSDTDHFVILKTEPSAKSSNPGGNLFPFGDVSHTNTLERHDPIRSAP